VCVLRLRAPLFLLLLSLHPLPAPGGPALPTNTPIDTTGNGRFDLVIVDGDYNGNGTISMQDVEDAARALTAYTEEPKEVRVVGSATYGVADVPSPSLLPRVGLLELDSNTTLECEPGVVLEGWDETIPDPNGHVVVNRDRIGGNREIHIRSCTIDGGQPESAYATSIGFRTAVWLDGCDDCVIEGSTLRNTFHACFYTRHGDESSSLGNRYENCGSTFLDVPDDKQGQPCLYAFAEAGRVTRGIHSVGDVMLGCGAPAFNVRREDDTASISDVEFRDATVEDTVLPAHGIHWGCFNLRGTLGGGLASGITCRRTAGFSTGSPGVATAGYDEEDTTQHARVSDVQFEDLQRELSLGPWSTDVVLSNPTITTTTATGIVIRPPNRDLVVEGATICAGRGGIVFDTQAGAPAALDPGDPAETTTIRNSAILCTDGDPGGQDFDGIEVRGGRFQKLLLENVDVSGATGNAVRVHDPAATGTPFELTIDGGSFEGTILAEDVGWIAIHGGVVERLVVTDAAKITLFGSDFVTEVAGTPVSVGYGDVEPGFDGRITGVLEDGSPLDVAAENLGVTSRIELRQPNATSLPYHATLEFELSPFDSLSVTGTGLASVEANGSLRSVWLAEGFSGSAVLPDLSTPGGVVSLRVSAAIGSGTLDQLDATGSADHGLLPVGGFYRVCMLVPGCGSSIDLPLTVNGTAGVGIGGAISFGSPVHRTQSHVGWLLGTAMLSDDLPGGPTTVLTRTGFLHGPSSATSSVATTSGVVQLVSPTEIAVAGDPGNTRDALFTTLRLRFVPEPAALAGLASGLIVLLVLAWRRLD
jgi:hypothetical protein